MRIAVIDKTAMDKEKLDNQMVITEKQLGSPAFTALQAQASTGKRGEFSAEKLCIYEKPGVRYF